MIQIVIYLSEVRNISYRRGSSTIAIEELHNMLGSDVYCIVPFVICLQV